MSAPDLNPANYPAEPIPVDLDHLERLSVRDWADLDAAQQDPEHDTTVERRKAKRGTCSCGWRGDWRRGKGAAWYAQADADDHYNDTADPSWRSEITVGEREDED